MPGYEMNSEFGFQQFRQSSYQNNNFKRLVILGIVGVLQPLQIYFAVQKVPVLVI